MKKKISASLLAMLLVFQVMSSGYLAPMAAFANEPVSTNETTDTQAPEQTAEQQAEAEAAQKKALEEAEQAVDDLFTDTTHKTIKEGLIDVQINTAEAYVDKLQDGTDKTKLQTLLAEARNQVAQAETKVTKEETPKQEVATEETTKEETVAEKPKKKLMAKAVTGTEITQDADLKVNVTKNGKELSPTDATSNKVMDGDTIKMKVTFDLSAENIEKNNYANGSYIRVKLPSDMLDEVKPNKGPIKAGEDTVGNYEILDGYLKITLTALVDESLDQPMEIEDGFVELTATLKSATDNTPGQDLTFGEPNKNGGEIKIPVTFVPKPASGGTKIQKQPGVIDPENGQIKWTVNVNTDLSLKDLQGTIKFVDQLPTDKLNYVSIKVTPIVYNLKGGEVEGTTEELTIPNDKTNFEYELKNLDSTGYKFEYVTENVSTADESKETISNTAQIKQGTTQIANSTNNVTVNYGPVLEKNVIQNGKEATWTIKYNHNQKTRTGKELELLDQFTNTHVLKGDLSNIKVQKVDGSGKVISDALQRTDYTIQESNTADKNGFLITFKADAVKGQAYTIVYTTKLADPDGIIPKTKTVTNDVSFGTKSTSNSITNNYNLGSKSSEVDYANKKINWEITVNPDNLALKNVVLTDTYPTDRGLKIAQDFKLNGEALDSSKLTKDILGEFTIKLGDITTAQTITYSTPYDVDTVTSTGITNNVKYTYTTENKVSEQETGFSHTETINEKQSVKNGYKSGNYNYVDRKFEWEAGFNYKRQNIKGAFFTDTLSENQKLEADTIKLYKVDLGTDDVNGKEIAVDMKTVGTLETTATGFTFTFNDTEDIEAYKFKYKSVDADGQMEAGKVYTNNATLVTDGTTKYNQDASVTINNAEHKIEKDAPKVLEDDQILNWQMIINKGQSKLTNVTIEDMPGSNQLILADTFKIEELTTIDGIEFDPSKVVLDSKDISSTDDGYTFTQNGFTVEQKIIGTGDQVSKGFIVTFPETIEKAYKITYSAYYNDAANTQTTNIATLKYNNNDKETAGESSPGTAKPYNIVYSGSNANATRTKADIKMHKVDPMDSMKPLQGAVFELYNGKGTVKIATGTTDANGDVIFKGYFEGTYQIKEVTAPAGYVTTGSQYSQKTQVKFLKDTNTLVTGTSNPVITKTIANYTEGACTKTTINVLKDGNKVANAIVKVKDQEGKLVTLTDATDSTPAVTELKTNAQGQVTLAAQYTSGNYKVEVTVNGITKTLSNFDIKDCAVTIDFNKDLACVDTTIYVKYKNQAVANAKVTINNGEELTVDSEGKVTVPTASIDGDIVVNDGLHNQTFKLSELQTDNDCNLTLNISDTSCPQLTVTVQDGTTLIKNAKVQILNSANEAQDLDGNGKTSLTTDDNGQVVIPTKYATGDYKIKVSKTGYKTATTPFDPTNCEFTVDFGVPTLACEDIEITFTGDQVNENKVYVVNQDGEKQKITADDKTETNLDAAGKVVIPSKYGNGDYKIVLVQDGQKSIATPINSDDCKQTIELPTNPDAGTPGGACENTTITVKDDTKLVENARVVITDQSGKELFNGLTDSKGQITTKDYIALKDMSVKVSAKGYNTTTTFTLSDEDCKAEVNLAPNACPDYAINVINEQGNKITAEGFLKDSAFTIKNQNNDVVATDVKINKNGQLYVVDGNGDEKIINKDELKNYTTDTYTLVQTKTAPGYQTMKDVEVQDLGDCSGLVTINFNKTTEPTQPGVSCPYFTIIYKGPADSTAEFKLVKVTKDATTGEVTKTDGEKDIKVVTDSTTKVSTLDLKDTKSFEPGSYELVQTKGTSGYYNSNDIPFEVKMGECVAELTVTNSVMPPPACTNDVMVTVKDTEGKAVSTENAKVTVDGKETTVTGSNSQVTIPKTALDSSKEQTVIITLEDGRTTTVVLPANRVDCTANAVVPVLKVCEQDKTITIKDANGKDVPADKIVKVTVGDKEVTPKVENGKLVISKDLINPKEDTTITVTTKGGEQGFVTIPKYSETCDYTIVIQNACDAFTVNVTENGKKATTGTVSIVDADGKTVATEKVSANGTAKFPAKYADAAYTVNVTIGKTTVTTPVNVNENCAVTVNVKTLACDEAAVIVTLDGKAQKGVKVSVVDSKGKVVQTVTTDAKGNAKIDPKYATKEYQVKVTVGKETKTVTMTSCNVTINFKAPVTDGETEEPTEPGKPNKPTTPEKPSKPGVVTGGDTEENTNSSKPSKPGVKPGDHYDVYDKDGNLVASDVTVDKDGSISADLPPGEYDFVSKGEHVTAEVGKDGKLPQTGSSDFLLYTLAGIALLGASLVVFARGRKKSA